MPSDYGSRGKAAAKLLKGKKPPGGDELGLPPMDEELPPEGGDELGNLAELLGGQGGAPMDPSAPPPPGPVDEAGMGEELPPEGPPEPMDLEGALAGVDSALEGMPPEVAEEIRMHMNAIREIASRGVSTEQPDMAAGGMPPMAAGETPPGAEELPA